MPILACPDLEMHSPIIIACDGFRQTLSVDGEQSVASWELQRLKCSLSVLGREKRSSERSLSAEKGIVQSGEGRLTEAPKKRIRVPNQLLEASQ